VVQIPDGTPTLLEVGVSCFPQSFLLNASILMYVSLLTSIVGHTMQCCGSSSMQWMVSICYEFSRPCS